MIRRPGASGSANAERVMRTPASASAGRERLQLAPSDGEQPGGQCGVVELGFGAPTGCGPETRAQRVVTQQSIERVAHAVHVARVDHEAGLAVDDGLVRAA